MCGTMLPICLFCCIGHSNQLLKIQGKLRKDYWKKLCALRLLVYAVFPFLIGLENEGGISCRASGCDSIPI